MPFASSLSCKGLQSEAEGLQALDEAFAFLRSDMRAIVPAAISAGRATSE